MEFRLLGPVAVLKGGVDVELGGPKRVALLAALLLQANRSCSADYLIDALWEGAPPPGSRATLQSHIAHLRRRLGPDSVRSAPGGYQLTVAPADVDAMRFEQALATSRAAARRGDLDSAVTEIEAALRLWVGDALGDLAARPFAAAEAARLERLRRDAIEMRLDALAGLGRFAEVAADAERALADEPWRERLSELLAHALYASGRQADALTTLRRARTSLREELGVDPSPSLGELEARILRQDPDLLPVSAVTVPEPVARSAAVPLALPVPLTSFVGRGAERHELRDALRRDRLVTVVGPGGSGKTRLSLAVAADAGADYIGGVTFVDLVPVTDVARVGAAVAARVGVGERQGLPPDEAVFAELADRHALMLLDNCEHLVAGVALFVERLLSACPHVTILATSRTRLLVPFERVLPIGGLSDSGTGDSPGDALQLFLARAEAAGAAAAALEDRATIEDVCRSVGGNALAIELAAARSPALGLTGLQAGLADHLRLLSGGARATGRHRSLRAAIDWSWELLEPDQQRVLRLVSIFVAPFSADAAAAVLGREVAEVTDLLATLTEQSMLAPVVADDLPYYRMLDALRQYASERLDAAGELPEAAGRHAAWCLRIAREILGTDVGTLRFGWFADNVRAAVRRAADDSDDAYELIMAFGNLLFDRGILSEAQQRFLQAASVAEDGPATAAALRAAAAIAFCRILGEESVRLLQAAADAVDGEAAAYDRATAAMTMARHTGVFAAPPEPHAIDALVAAARASGDGDDSDRVQSVLASTNSFRRAATGGDGTALADQAARLAAAARDVLAESAALDAMQAALMAVGDVSGAAQATRRRAELLSALPQTPAVGPELVDTLHTAAELSMGAGDLRDARRWALQLNDLRFLAEQEHVTTNRIMVIDALIGDWEAVLGASREYRTGWERANRPRGPILARGAAAVAMVHGCLGDTDAFEQWRQIAVTLGSDLDMLAGFAIGWAPVFDGIRLLHLGRHDEAVTRLSAHPAELSTWRGATWRQWYAALWAEAAVLGGHPAAADRVAVAGEIVVGNGIAAAIVDRARGVHERRPELLHAAAQRLDELGGRYQRSRTLEFLTH